MMLLTEGLGKEDKVIAYRESYMLYNNVHGVMWLISATLDKVVISPVTSL